MLDVFRSATSSNRGGVFTNKATRRTRRHRMLLLSAAAAVGALARSEPARADTYTFDYGAVNAGPNQNIQGNLNGNLAAATNWYDLSTSATSPNPPQLTGSAPGASDIAQFDFTYGNLNPGGKIPSLGLTLGLTQTSWAGLNVLSPAVPSDTVSNTGITSPFVMTLVGSGAGSSLRLGASGISLSGTDTAIATSVTLAAAQTWAVSNVVTTSAGVVSNTTALALNNNLSLGGRGASALTFTLGGNINIAGVISDGGATSGIVMNNSGVLTLGSANTYSGGTNLKAGTVSFSQTTALGAAGSPVTFANGDLAITGTLMNNLNAYNINKSGAGAFVQWNNVPVKLTLANVANTFTIGQTLTGTSSVTLAGSGELQLSGINSYTGATKINGGTLAIADDIAVNSGVGGITFSNGGTLLMENFTSTLSFASGAQLAAAPGFASSLSGTIAGAGSGLTFMGPGTLSLAASNTYTGTTAINGGTLELDFSAPGAPASAIISAASALQMNGGTLLVNKANAAASPGQAFSGTTFGQGANVLAIANTGGGSPVLNLGAITINPGATVQFIGPATIGAGNVTVNALGTIDTSTGTAGSILSAPAVDGVDLADYATVGLYDWAAKDAGNTFVVGGSQITGFYTEFNSTSSMVLTGNADIQENISSHNTDAPASIRFNTPGANLTLGTILGTGGVLVTPNVGANNTTISGPLGAFEATRTPTHIAQLVIWQNNTLGALLISSGIGESKSTGSTTVEAGPGLVVMSINGYTGQTYLNGGVTEISSDAGLGAPASAAVVNLAGGTIFAAGVFSLDNLGANARPIVVNAAGGTISAGTGQILTVDGPVSGGGPLTIGMGQVIGTGSGTANPTALFGVGTVVFTQSNSYTGPTNITAGLLRADGVNSLGAGGAVTLASGASLYGTPSGNSRVVANFGSSVNVGDNLGGSGIMSLASLTLNGATTNFVPNVSSIVLGSGGTLTLTGADAINLNNPGSAGAFTPLDGTNTYNLVQLGSGGIVGNLSDLFPGNPQPSTSYAFGQSGGFLTVTINSTLPNSQFAYDQSVPWNTAANWIGGIPNTAGATALFPASPPNPPSGTSAGSAITVTLPGNETVGVVNFGTPGAATPDSCTIAAAGGTLHLNGGSVNIGTQIDSAGGNYAIAAPINIDANTATLIPTNDAVSGTASMLSISGAIGGPGALAVGGNGMVLFTGANTYAGSTNVGIGATLQIGAGGAIGSLPASSAVTNNGTLIFNRADGTIAAPVLLANTLFGTGTLVQAGSGVLGLTGGNSMFTGPVNINAGTLQIGNTTAIGGANAVSIAANALLDLNGNSISVNSLSGAGTVDDVTAGASPRLSIGGSGGTFAGLIRNTSGTVGINFNTTGAVSFTNPANSFTGGATINGGAVLVNAGGELGTGTITVNVISGLELVNGAVVANNIVSSSGLPFEDIPSANSTATLSGNITTTPGGQYRLIVTGANSTLALTGISTSTSIVDIESGDILFTGNAALTDNTGSAFLLGRSTAPLNLTLAGNAALTQNGPGGIDLGIDDNIAVNGGFNLLIQDGAILNAGITGINLYASTKSKMPSTITVGGGTEMGPTLATGPISISDTAGTTLNFNGGTLTALTGDPLNGQFFPNLSADNLATVIQSGGATINNNGFSITIAQPLVDGGGGVTLSGAGTTTFSASNTYSGSTNITGGTLVLAAVNSLPVANTVINNGALVVNANTTSGSITGAAGVLSVGAGATLTLAPGSGVSSQSAVTIAQSTAPLGTLDITDNKLVLNFGAPANDPAATIRAYLQSGYNGDQWTGTGIISSNAAANPGLYAVGYADGNSDPGTAASANQILIENTIAGDANLDGVVNFPDLLVVAQNFGKTGQDWAHGDFNYDGIVNFPDLLLIAQNFGKMLPTDQLDQLPVSFAAEWQLAETEIHASGPNSVPEPAGPALLAICVAGLLARRRRGRA